MVMKILKKQVVEDVNVYDAALERFRYLFDNFDKVVVSFSGGKDSTVCLN
jgi:predicted phosphoadenosine phosphosulfate sulfurtransferase